MTVTKTTFTPRGPIVEVEDGRTACESQLSKIPVAYRTCPLCRKVYAEAIGGLWHKIILDGNEVWVCAGCVRGLTRLVEG